MTKSSQFYQIVLFEFIMLCVFIASLLITLQEKKKHISGLDKLRSDPQQTHTLLSK